MTTATVSMREMQRNYSSLIRQAKRTRRPVFLASRGKTEGVLLDVASYEEIQEVKSSHKKRSWEDIKSALKSIRASGKQNVSLSAFVHEDRQRHIDA